MAERKKIPQMPGKKLSSNARKSGMEAMSKAMITRARSTKAHKEMSKHKAKKI